MWWSRREVRCAGRSRVRGDGRTVRGTSSRDCLSAPWSWAGLLLPSPTRSEGSNAECLACPTAAVSNHSSGRLRSVRPAHFRRSVRFLTHERGRLMPAPAAPVQQFVVLPTRGLRATAATSSPALAPFLVEFSTAQTAAAARSFVASANLNVKPAFRVLDSIHEDGAKLVEMSDDVAKAILASPPGLRIVPVVSSRPALVRYPVEQRVRAAAA